MRGIPTQFCTIIEEKGGVNLYGFVRNNGSNKVDKLGLFDIVWNCLWEGKVKFKMAAHAGLPADTFDDTQEGSGKGSIKEVASAAAKQDLLKEQQKYIDETNKRGGWPGMPPPVFESQTQNNEPDCQKSDKCGPPAPDIEPPTGPQIG